MSDIRVSFKDRIATLIEKKGISKKKFAQTIGISTGNLSDWLKGRSEPSSETLSRIYENYKDLNPKWLLSGKGEALLKETSIKEAAGLNETDEGRDFIKTLEGLLMRLNVKDDHGAVSINEEQIHEEIMQLFSKLDTDSLEKMMLMIKAMLLRQKNQDKEQLRRRAEQERPGAGG